MISIIIGIALLVIMVFFVWSSLVVSSECSRYEEMEEIKMMDERKVKYIKETYKEGTEIELISMDDPYAVPSGTKGKVFHVDDEGQIHVSWDNGSTLAVIVGVDKFKVIKEVDNDIDKGVVI